MTPCLRSYPLRVLSFDPGATRAGWAVLETGPKYLGSGVKSCPKLPTQSFQNYRLELANAWVVESFALIESFEPDVVVSETVPSRGAGIPEQLYLANIQITTVHAIAMAFGLPVEQVSARTVQAEIAQRKQGVKV